MSCNLPQNGHILDFTERALCGGMMAGMHLMYRGGVEDGAGEPAL